jgi:hypothetical protein
MHSGEFFFVINLSCYPLIFSIDQLSPKMQFLPSFVSKHFRKLTGTREEEVRRVFRCGTGPLRSFIDGIKTTNSHIRWVIYEFNIQPKDRIGG